MTIKSGPEKTKAAAEDNKCSGNAKHVYSAGRGRVAVILHPLADVAAQGLADVVGGRPEVLLDSFSSSSKGSMPRPRAQSGQARALTDINADKAPGNDQATDYRVRVFSSLVMTEET